MTKSRKTLFGIAAGLAAVTLALSPAGVRAADSGQDYVTVTNEGGVVRIGTQVPGQPLLSASVDTNTGEVCMGFSYQMPFCASAGVGVGTSSAIPSPVWVDADGSDGFVGAGVRIGTGSIAAVGYWTTAGYACVTIGMARPICAQLT